MSRKFIRNVSFSVGGIITLTGLTLIFFGVVSIGVVLFLGGLIIGILPYGIYSFFQDRIMQSMEEHFPSFLRDLAEAQKSGASITQAFFIVKTRDYGYLSREIRRAANQMSWGVPFPEVMKDLSNRLGESQLIKSSLDIILQSFHSGGDITKTIETLNQDVTMIKDSEKQKKTVLNQQVLIIYVIFFLFVIILISLYKFMVPMLGTGFQGIGGAEVKNFCAVQMSKWMCNLCALFKMGSANDSICYYKMLFFFMISVEAVFSGLVAGYVGEGRASAGLKHILIMAVIGIVGYILFIAL